MPRTAHSLSEKVPKISARRALVALLGAVAVFWGLNVLAGRYLEQYSPNQGYRVIWKKWGMVLGGETANAKALLLGDSSGNQGGDSDALTDSLGGSVFNLATVGNLILINDAAQLAEHIDRNGAPKIVILVHVYDVWHRNLSADEATLLPYSAIAGDTALGSRITFGKWFVFNHFPLYSQNVSLLHRLKHPAKAFDANSHFTETGFMPVTQPNEAIVEEDFQGHLNFLRENPTFRMSADNRHGLNRILLLAEQHNFDVHLLNSPIYEKLAANDSFKAYYAQLCDTMHAWQARRPRLHWASDTLCTFPASQMENVDHVTTVGAAVYTRHLFAAIKRS